MPVSLKVCAQPGCSELVPSGYCAKHEQLKPQPWGGKRWKGNTTDRGYGYEWQQLRERILKRDAYLCQRCRAHDAQHVHHIKWKADGGTDKPENLMSLCKGCHEELHKR